MKICKAVLLVYCILVFIVIFAFIRCIFFSCKRRRQLVMSYAIHAFGRVALFIVGIRLSIDGSAASLRKGVFFITNHVSYLDGIVAAGMFPLIFISRGDLKTWPLFGIFSSLSETIFVNRIGSSGICQEIERIGGTLKNGVSVILFPEGTTTEGNGMIPFKSSFFQAPIESGSCIVPFTIRYTKVNGRPLDANNKDSIFWYGDMEFAPHLFQLMGLRSIEVQVRILEPVKSAAIGDRKALGNLCQKVIQDSLSAQ